MTITDKLTAVEGYRALVQVECDDRWAATVAVSPQFPTKAQALEALTNEVFYIADAIVNHPDSHDTGGVPSDEEDIKCTYRDPDSVTCALINTLKKWILNGFVIECPYNSMFDGRVVESTTLLSDRQINDLTQTKNNGKKVNKSTRKTGKACKTKRAGKSKRGKA